MRALLTAIIHRPIATSMFYLFLLLLGVISLRGLEVNLLPDLEYPRLTVVTLYSNASPEEIEHLISTPITESVGTVSGIRSVSSESMEGVSFVTVQFDWGTNVDFAAMDVREKVDLIRGILPEDAGKPVVTKFDPAAASMFEIAFFPTGMSKPRDLKFFLKSEVKSHLDRVDGVAHVEFSGGYDKEIRVDVDQAAMVSHGISLDEIINAVESSNLNVPAGHITQKDRDLLVRTIGEYRNVPDVGRTVVGRNDAGVPVSLSSIAGVYDGYRERTGLALYNGKEAVIASLYREAGKNTIEVANRVRNEINRLNKVYEKDFKAVVIYDESRFVKSAVDGLKQDLIMGGLLAFLSLFIVLKNLRSPFVLLTALPISVMVTFVLMYFQGLTLNLMTLGGITLGVGMLFDAGNVTLSAIERHSQAGQSHRQAAVAGALEVSGSVTTAVLTTVIIFLPIVFLKGVVGVVFAEMALTVIYSNMVSLVVALTLVPMLSGLAPVKQGNTPMRLRFFFDRVSMHEDRLITRYRQLLESVIDRPSFLLTRIGIAFMAALVILLFVERESTPKVDSGVVDILIENTRGSTLQSTADLVSMIEDRLSANPDVEHILARVGYDEQQILTRKGGDFGTHRATMKILLRENRAISSRELAEVLRKSLPSSEGVRITVNVSEDLIGSLLSPDARGIAIDIQGDDLDTLVDIGRVIRSDLAKISGLVDVRSSIEEKNKEFHVLVDESKLSGMQISESQVSYLMRSAVMGMTATRLRDGDRLIDIRVRFREEDRASAESLSGFLMKSPSGSYLHLAEFARIENREGYTSILKSGGIRVNRIQSTVQGRKQKDVLADVEDYVERLRLPVGYSVRFAGEKESIDESFRELTLALLLAVILIFMLLAGYYESLKFPAVMLASIPLVLIGIAPALFFTGKSLNISSFTGIILLVGIVVDNAALFYEYVEILHKEGHTLRDSVLEAATITVRPILMNGGTTMLGLVPVALELGEGSEFQSPMAVVIISGLLASSLISLFLIPTLFKHLLEARKRHG